MGIRGSFVFFLHPVLRFENASAANRVDAEWNINAAIFPACLWSMLINTALARAIEVNTTAICEAAQ
jgi:hypothetical protein